MAGHLQFVKSIKITTDQSTTSVTNVFSDAYSVYEIYADGISTVGTNQSDLNMRFIDSSDNVISDNEYDYAHKIMRADTTFSEQKNTGQAQFLRAFSESTDQKPEGQGAKICVFNPYDSDTYTYITYQSNTTTSALKIAMKGIGVHKSVERITGFQMHEINGNRPYNGGHITVYGVK